jgi:preprotein translocase subunit SecD
MTKNWWYRCALLSFFVILSSVYVYPTLSGLDLEKTKFPFKQKINLGLDLQGGLYMVLGVDFNRVFRDVVERQGQSLQDTLKDKGLMLSNLKVLKEESFGDDPRVSLDVPAGQMEKFKELLKKDFWVLRLAEEKGNTVQVGLSRDYRQDVRDRTLSQSIEVIRNRIDEFGVSEPSIASQGTDRVVVELPGVKDVDRAKDLIGRTARLEFKIVDDKTMSPAQVASIVQTIEEENKIVYSEKMKFSEYTALINEKAKTKIPEGTQILFERVKTFAGDETVSRVAYLIRSRVEVTGDDLQDANVGIDPENRRPEVNLSFNPKGTVLFDKVTGDHVGERLAIVLDNVVHSAPVLQTRIANGHARITLGQSQGDRAMSEAKDLATVLRAGALPAQLDFLEQRVVGPSLGQDSIHKGAVSALVGALLVFMFVTFYYRASGVIAVATLILNVLFVLACLVGLEATLTLPGIAGIALTVGIAVDSNVVIYERIREEIRAGRAVAAAVEAGFQKAFRTILDANVTNAAAAIVLLVYGTGPIKGFAVTMLIGIVTTLFTAVFACKLIFDAYVQYLGNKKSAHISI